MIGQSTVGIGRFGWLAPVIEVVEADHFGGRSGVAEMAEPECECKSDRLRRHVEGLLGESEQDMLADHLEWCDQCRGALDELAGDDRLWTDLRARFLAARPTSRPRGLAPPVRPRMNVGAGQRRRLGRSTGGSGLP